jgi:hypothetical protein
MPLRRLRSPKSHHPVLRDARESLHFGENLGTGAKARSEPEIQDQLPVFTVGLQSLLLPGGLSRTKRSSWRYLIRAGRGPARALDIADTPDAVEAATLRQWRHGDSVQRLRKHVQACEKHPKLKGRTYAVRLLRIPALHFSALWLKATKKRDDIFVPLESLYKPLRVGHHYSTEQVESVVPAAAERVLSFKF